jgi:hypothetical protein
LELQGKSFNQSIEYVPLDEGLFSQLLKARMRSGYFIFVTQTKRVHPPAGLHVEEKTERRPRRGENWTANKTNI